MSEINRILIKVSPLTAVVFCIVFVPLIVIGVAKIMDPAQMVPGCLLCVSYIFAVYWMCSPTVILEGKVLRHQTLFTRRTLNLETITEVEVTARPIAIIKLYDPGRSQPFQFVIKPFSKAGVAAMIHYIRLNAKDAKFNTISADIEKHDFTSITREALQVRNWIQFFLTLVGISFTAALIRALLHLLH